MRGSLELFLTLSVLIVCDTVDLLNKEHSSIHSVTATSINWQCNGNRYVRKDHCLNLKILASKFFTDSIFSCLLCSDEGVVEGKYHPSEDPLLGSGNMGEREE